MFLFRILCSYEDALVVSKKQIFILIWKKNDEQG